ncbi:MAG: rod-binding protein [Lachnospiraceae bacterium]|jgi:flagellar protein FlgJ|nr:rod-binding protein [Lachnospiraceae bacterium]MEE3460981.1 rod-binding protein [Lachnospiraceae bacterium]
MDISGISGNSYSNMLNTVSALTSSNNSGLNSGVTDADSLSGMPGYTAGMSDSLSSASSAVSGAQADALSSKIRSLDRDTDDQELYDACKSFESYFVQKVLENERKALLPDDEIMQGEYMSVFGDKLTEEYSKILTDNNGGIGLARQLYESMKRNMGEEPDPAIMSGNSEV